MQFFQANSLAEHLWRRAARSRWGPRYGGSKNFEFPGLRGRKLENFGYRYGGDLERAARSHTLAAAELLELTSIGTAFTHKFCYRTKIRFPAYKIVHNRYLLPKIVMDNVKTLRIT